MCICFLTWAVQSDWGCLGRSMYIYIYLFIYLFIILYLYLHLYLYLYLYLDLYVFMCVFIYIYMCVCVYKIVHRLSQEIHTLFSVSDHSSSSQAPIISEIAIRIRYLQSANPTCPATLPLSSQISPGPRPCEDDLQVDDQSHSRGRSAGSWLAVPQRIIVIPQWRFESMIHRCARVGRWTHIQTWIGDVLIPRLDWESLPRS